MKKLNETEKKILAEKNKYYREHPEERRKELLEKRKYYREHPEKAEKEYVNNFDGY